jgi:hypothetical protein
MSHHEMTRSRKVPDHEMAHHRRSHYKMSHITKWPKSQNDQNFEMTHNIKNMDNNSDNLLSVLSLGMYLSLGRSRREASCSNIDLVSNFRIFGVSKMLNSNIKNEINASFEKEYNQQY